MKSIFVISWTLHECYHLSFILQFLDPQMNDLLNLALMTSQSFLNWYSDSEDFHATSEPTRYAHF